MLYKMIDGKRIAMSEDEERAFHEQQAKDQAEALLHRDLEHDRLLKAEMAAADVGIVRALIEGDAERVAAHRAAQDERRGRIRVKEVR